jgi:hypothetical protein
VIHPTPSMMHGDITSAGRQASRPNSHGMSYFCYKIS